MREEARGGVDLLGLIKVMQAAANDTRLTDREVRFLVRLLSTKPYSERDVLLTQAYAKQFGWEIDHEGTDIK